MGRKNEIYLKVEYLDQLPEDRQMNLEIYDPRDIMVTGWYKDHPDVMIDSQLTVEFPELDDQFKIFICEEPAEGTIIVYSTGHVDLHTVLGVLNQNNWDARALMTIN